MALGLEYRLGCIGSSKYTRCSAQYGFSFLELAFVLAVIGVLSLLANFAFSGADGVRRQQYAQAQAEVVREALRYYLLANKRLPCPDFNDDGYEDRDAGGACTQNGEIGSVPYYAIGLTPSEENRMVYGVYRAAPPNDITSLEERTGGDEGAPGYMGIDDTIIALIHIPVIVSGSVHIHVAGVNVNGSSNCDAAASTYPAFVLIMPNIDRDNDSRLLDGVNAANVNNHTTSCISSPLQPLTQNYDDVVTIESPNTLIGWLTEHIS